jgi:FHS family L-fucose permease-like MFS transporter
MEEGMDEKSAEILSQKYNIFAMILFTISRFICTWFLKYISAGRLLSILAICAIALASGAILFTDRNGLYCLVFVSGCMSLMFPTIFGLSMHNLGDHTKMGSAGLIMAILGGSLFPPLQAIIVNSGISLLGVPSINVSFILPLCCFGVVVWYAHQAYIRFRIIPEEPDDDDMLSTPAPIE